MGKWNAVELHRAYNKKESIALKWPRKRAFMKHPGNISILDKQVLDSLKYVICMLCKEKKNVLITTVNIY